jgi:hypothetical protein
MRGVEVKETGHATVEERNEATEWFLEKIVEGPPVFTACGQADCEFVESMQTWREQGRDVSPRQYFYLKDIYDRLVDRGLI